ncbi:host-nuclease inhibitor Gam family protein [Melioribacter sp. Ez-97]|uniref:host-nuclease inhibitor Gam family protein n=1 Tax=Melioribacter sp. Ez-97 TaxID=3423434 RepID=UPI003EDA390C
MQLRNFDDVNNALREIAECDSFIADREIKMNEKINELKSAYEEETSEARSRKLALEKELEKFCIKNKNEFGSARTKNLLFGKIFFRTTPPKVSLLNRKYTVATAVELASKLFKNKYVRIKKELDKDAILASYAAKEIDDERLAAIGLKIDQQEKFGYEINWENLKES